MKYFGMKPPLGLERDSEAPTPVGVECIWCDEKIVDGDSGVVMPFLAEGEEDKIALGRGDQQGVTIKFTEAPYHFECIVRSTVGSVGHLMGMCSCHGGDDEDPKGMTRRQAAIAAVIVFRALQQKDEEERRLAKVMMEKLPPAQREQLRRALGLDDD